MRRKADEKRGGKKPAVEPKRPSVRSSRPKQSAKPAPRRPTQVPLAESLSAILARNDDKKRGGNGFAVDPNVRSSRGKHRTELMPDRRPMKAPRRPTAARYESGNRGMRRNVPLP